MRALAAVIVISLFSTAVVTAQSSDDTPLTGDAAVAEKYLLWAEDAIGAGHWSKAETALERAADFAGVLSDLSYLLALARSKENKSRISVLEALQQAIRTNRWLRYTEAHAQLLLAEQFIVLRQYTAALDSLARYRAAAAENADAALLRLAALKGLAAAVPGNETLRPLPAPVEFRRRLLETLDRYPHDPRPLRLLFDYARGLKSVGNNPSTADMALVEIALRRLPFLLEHDPELAWMAVPFVADTAEARRLISAYRAGGLASGEDRTESQAQSSAGFKPHPASIISALDLGLIDDQAAVDELFAETVIQKEHIVAVGDLLRSGEGREYLNRKLHTFTGAITENEDNDHYLESRAKYQLGSLVQYFNDSDQDGSTNLYVSFNSGDPRQAVLALLPSPEGGAAQAVIQWERYPLVQQARLGKETYLFAPDAFLFAPLEFTELGASDSAAGLLFPRRGPQGQGISRRMLASAAVSVRHPSGEFDGGVEQIFLERGMPVHAEITLGGLMVAVTAFENGSPVTQWLDLDLDGRMETTRRFNKIAGGNPPEDVISPKSRYPARSSESDWNGDGSFSTAEVYQNDGSVVYIWDLDGTGRYRYSETRTGNE